MTTRNRVKFFRPVTKFIKTGTAPLKSKARQATSKVEVFLKTRPLTSFVVLLAILLILIAAAKFIRKPKEVETPQTQVKEVRVFKIGSAPTVVLHAKAEKSTVVDIVAQSPSIVTKILVIEGQTVNRGTQLVTLSTNYLGASVASAQRQLAQAQYTNTKDTQSTKKDLISKQRELTEKTDTQADELRDITSKSLEGTRNLVSTNDSILSTLDTNLKNLEATNTGGSNDALILQTKQLRSQFLAANNQAKTQLAQNEFQSQSDQEPAQISSLSKDITLKQLEIEEKSQDLSLEVSRLQLVIAQITESTMFPQSPFTGRVERVHVKFGDSVSPGTPLVTLSQETGSASAVILTTDAIAKSISKLSPSYFLIEGQKIEAGPPHISQEAVSNGLFAVVFSIPKDLQAKVVNNSSVDVSVPIGYDYAAKALPFVPIDSVHQTQVQAVLYVVRDGKAAAKAVQLGSVHGEYVEILEGLAEDDEVILDRNVVDQDPVIAQTVSI